MKRVWPAALLLAAAADAAPPGAIQHDAAALAWRAAPNLPAGAQAAVLEGDPAKDGLFTLRLQVPAGTRLPPHWHPRDERVTVLSGEVWVGFGETADEAAGRRFTAGSYYVNPARAPHYVWFTADSVVQVTAQGPWELHYGAPPADAGRKFRYGAPPR